MTLEAAIQSLDAKIEKLIAVTETLVGLRTDAIETVKTAAASPAKATAKPKETIADVAKDVGAAVDVAAKTAEEKAKTSEAEAKAAAAAAHPIGAKIMQFVQTGYAEDHPQAAEERAARVAKVKALYAAVAKATGKEVASYGDIPEEYTKVALEKLDGFIAAGTIVITASKSLDI